MCVVGKRPVARFLAMVPLAICLTSLALAAPASELQVSAVTLVVADDAVMNVAEVVKQRLELRSGITVVCAKEPVESAALSIHLGRIGVSPRFDALCEKHTVHPPGKESPYAEGYALKRIETGTGPVMIAAGADKRGVLYAAGEILRRLRCLPDAVAIGDVDVAAAPAYRFRGCSANQGGTMRQVTGARAWTAEEWQEKVLDYALAGANAFYTGHYGGAQYDFAKSFDLMSVTGVRPNEMGGEFPEEWRAGGLDGWEGQHWVCPSIPEVRAALLAKWEGDFARRPFHDVLRFYAGDPGGCRDERCAPWGKTFVHLCEEVAALWLARYPESVIQIANQDLTNAGDQAIFDYLNAEPRPWLHGICYGPGSNALSPYFRDELREDLFEYPGHGPTNRYLSETLRHLPADQRITNYSDITHWISAQYEVENPERNIIRSYGRRTFHTRPKAFYRIFQQIMPFTEGDIIYSEGYHDELHQYLWCRLLWEPNRDLDEVLSEYARFHFGAEAAEPMVQAMHQLEQNLEAPLAANDGIGRFYDLVAEAGARIPPHRKDHDYRWQLYMQKAALDKYVQGKLRGELTKAARIRALLGDADGPNALREAVEDAKAILGEPPETEAMAKLRKEAGKLGDETEARYGVRNVGYFRLDKPLRDPRGLIRRLNAVADARSRGEGRKLRDAVLDYLGAPAETGNIFW